MERILFKIADVVEVIGARGAIILFIVGIVAHGFGVRILQEVGL